MTCCEFVVRGDGVPPHIMILTDVKTVQRIREQGDAAQYRALRR